MRTLKGKFTQWQETHHNPFTPKLEEKIQVGDNKIIELAKSRHKEFYGVAVWQNTGEDCDTCNNDRPHHKRFEAVEHDLNKPFHDEQEAKDYMQLLKEKLRNHEEIEQVLNEVEQ